MQLVIDGKTYPITKKYAEQLIALDKQVLPSKTQRRSGLICWRIVAASLMPSLGAPNSLSTH